MTKKPVKKGAKKPMPKPMPGGKKKGGAYC